LITKELFGGPWLAGRLVPAKARVQKMARRGAAADCKHPDRLLLAARWQITASRSCHAPRQFRTAAQDFVELLNSLMERRGALEVQLLAGFFALFFNGSTHRTAARFQKNARDACTSTSYSSLLHPAEAGREAHFHL